LRFNIAGRDSFDIARREILLRKIGDELLTQSGDNRSKVLPVKKIAENEYQISFEHGLTFHPDSLVNTTRRLLAQDPLASDYVVNVLNCSDSSVAYGYAISNNTGTEARLLLIFALSPNQTIERSRVQKRNMGRRRHTRLSPSHPPKFRTFALYDTHLHISTLADHCSLTQAPKATLLPAFDALK